MRCPGRRSASYLKSDSFGLSYADQSIRISHDEFLICIGNEPSCLPLALQLLKTLKALMSTYDDRFETELVLSSRQLCQWISLLLQSQRARSIFGPATCTHLESTLKGVASLLGHEDRHVEDKEDSSILPSLVRGNLLPSNQSQQDLGLTHFLSLLEWMIGSIAFHLALHHYIINSTGSRNDPFFTLLISFLSSSAQFVHSGEETAVSEATHQEIRRPARLKHFSTEFRRTMPRRRFAGETIVENNGILEGSDSPIESSSPHPTSEAQRNKASGQHQGVTIPCVSSEPRRIRSVSSFYLKNQEKSKIIHPNDQPNIVRIPKCSIDSLVMSINILIHNLCMSMLPVILWTYLSRCIYPNTVRTNATSDHDGCSNSPWRRDSPAPVTLAVDDILGLELVITTALGHHSSILLARSRAFLSSNKITNDSFLIRFPFYGPRGSSVYDPTQSNFRVGRTIPERNQGSEKTETKRFGESTLIDFNLIDSANNDDRVIAASKGKANNRFFESAIATVTTPLLPQHRHISPLGTTESDEASRPLRRQYINHSSNNNRPLLAGMRQPLVEGHLFSSVQWNDRLRPFLVLQFLRLIRLEFIPLIQSIDDFAAVHPPNISPFLIGNATMTFLPKSPVPGLFLSFSCLHFLLSSLVSFNFQPVDVFFLSSPMPESLPCQNILPTPSHHFDFRFPVDEEFMIQSFLVLIELKRHLSSYNFTSSSTNMNEASIDLQFALHSLTHSLSELSIQFSLDSCLLRAQYEILPRSVLMMLSFNNIKRKITT